MKVSPLEQSLTPLAHPSSAHQALIERVSNKALKTPHSLTINIVGDKDITHKSSNIPTVKAAPCLSRQNKILAKQPSCDYVRQKSRVTKTNAAPKTAVALVAAATNTTTSNAAQSNQTVSDTPHTSNHTNDNANAGFGIAAIAQFIDDHPINTQHIMSASFFISGMLLMFYLLHLA